MWVAAIVGGVLIIALAAIWSVAGTETILARLGILDDARYGGPEAGVNLSEVADNPSAMYGETVTISGGLEEIVAPHAVIIGDDRFLIGDTVLVIGAENLPALGETQAGDVTLQVTGVVRPFDRDTIEERAGGGLDDGSLDDYIGESMILAQEIEVDPPVVGPGDTERREPSAGWDPGTDIDDIVDNTEAYVGKTVTISGEVEKLIGPYAFLLADDKMLAITPSRRDELFVEPTAYITGTIRVFSLPETEEEIGIDLEDEQFAEFEGKPAILVEELELVK